MDLQQASRTYSTIRIINWGRSYNTWLMIKWSEVQIQPSQVCKYRAVFKIICSHKNCQIQDGYARQLKYFFIKRENKHEEDKWF